MLLFRILELLEVRQPSLPVLLKEADGDSSGACASSLLSSGGRRGAVDMLAPKEMLQKRRCGLIGVS